MQLKERDSDFYQKSWKRVLQKQNRLIEVEIHCIYTGKTTILFSWYLRYQQKL